MNVGLVEASARVNFACGPLQGRWSLEYFYAVLFNPFAVK